MLPPVPPVQYGIWDHQQDMYNIVRWYDKVLTSRLIIVSCSSASSSSSLTVAYHFILVTFVPPASALIALEVSILVKQGAQ